MKRVLGLDFGNVIRPSVPDGQHGSFDLPGDGYLDSPDFPDAKPCLRILSRHFDEIHLISRSGDGRWDDRRLWLSRHGYDEIIPPDKVHFCRNYADKLPICTDLGVTHFVDDNLVRILSTLATSVPNLFWFRNKENMNPEDQGNLHLVDKLRVTVVGSWSELLGHLVR